MQDKEKHVIYIRSLKQALYHRLILKKRTEFFNVIKKHG